MHGLDRELRLGAHPRGAREDRVERAHVLAGMARARGHDHLAEQLPAEHDVVRAGVALVGRPEAAGAERLEAKQRERIVHAPA